MLHSASSQPGGTFTIAAEIRDGDHVRIEARDDGGPWREQDHDDGRPHGLHIVASLAASHGVSGDPLTGWTTWAILPWHPRPFPTCYYPTDTPMTTNASAPPAATLPQRRPGTHRAAAPRPARPPGYDLNSAWQLLAETRTLPGTRRGLLIILTRYRRALHDLATEMQAIQRPQQPATPATSPAGNHDHG